MAMLSRKIILDMESNGNLSEKPCSMVSMRAGEGPIKMQTHTAKWMLMGKGFIEKLGR